MYGDTSLCGFNLQFPSGELHPTPVLLPGKSHGQRSLVGCSPWGREESDRTEWLRFHFSLSCIGEGNGNPLQCSCLENPKDGRAWWAASYGVAYSRIRSDLAAAAVGNDVQYVFMCLRAIYTSFSAKCLFISFADFLIRLFGIFCYGILKVLCIFQILVLCWICGLQVFSSTL